MTMKKTELEKRAGLRVAHQMKHAAALAQRTPQGPGPEDRRARREADRQAGRVPFAVKLPQSLVTQLQTLAQQRALTLDLLTTQLLQEGVARHTASSSTTD